MIKTTLKTLTIVIVSLSLQINAQEVVKTSRIPECEFYEQIYNNVDTKFENIKGRRTNDDAIFPEWSSKLKYSGFLKHSVIPKYGLYLVSVYGGPDEEKAQELFMNAFNSWASCAKTSNRTFFKVSDKDTTAEFLGERVVTYSSDQDYILIKFKYKKNKIYENNKMIDHFEVDISFSHYNK